HWGQQPSQVPIVYDTTFLTYADGRLVRDSSIQHYPGFYKTVAMQVTELNAGQYLIKVKYEDAYSTSIFDYTGTRTINNGNLTYIKDSAHLQNSLTETQNFYDN